MSERALMMMDLQRLQRLSLEVLQTLRDMPAMRQLPGHEVVMVQCHVLGFMMHACGMKLSAIHGSLGLQRIIGQGYTDAGDARDYAAARDGEPQ